jgi:hypothetical protein
MEIPVLEALKEAENGNFDKLTVHIETQEIWQIFKDIEDLLERQREKCADEAKLNSHTIAGSYINKKSILNAKLF